MEWPRKTKDRKLYQQCVRKRRYTRHSEAHSELLRLKDPNLDIYPCPHCKNFHLGHKYNKQKQ